MHSQRRGVAAWFWLALAVSSSQAAQPDPDRFIVKFQPGQSASARAALANAGGRVALELPDAVAAVLSPGAVQALSRNPNVAYVEPDVVRYPLALATPADGTPYATGQLVPYGIAMVQADQLSGVDASNRKLCIIDSGIDAQHEDLAGNALTGEYDAGTGWWYTDENHHGSHVAGTIAAVNQPGIGVVGVHANRQLRVHIVKVFGADGWAYSSTLSAAANKCAAAGANIISMSLGGSVASRTEQNTFDALYKNNVLSVAAAGNGGNSRNSYPASYSSVMSVAAVDENKAWASFSQYNKQVEIAAPGVGVLSTVPMGAGSRSALTVGSTTYVAGDMEGSPKASVSAPLADFGLGGTATAGSMAGKVCLIQRGTYDFAVKVSNCQASGGVGAVIYNNVAGGFSGTLGTTVTSIPSLSASDTDGAAMKATQLGQPATVAVSAWNYAYYDGTSMATPHVAAVAALVWSKNPACTAAQVRSMLTATAQDLGPAGRDTKFGYGLVQAKAAYDRLPTSGSCR